LTAAQAAVVTALAADGLAVVVEREGATFARLAASDPSSGETSTLELGVDWRAFLPVQLAIGPVLHPVDAAANKLCALFGRAAVHGPGEVSECRLQDVLMPRSVGAGEGR
jgi:hypothetical protein